MTASRRAHRSAISFVQRGLKHGEVPNVTENGNEGSAEGVAAALALLSVVGVVVEAALGLPDGPEQPTSVASAITSRNARTNPA